MFLILCSLLIAAEAAKLDNTYLPPTGAKESGGNDGDLQVPLEPPYIDPYTPQNHYKSRPQYRPTTRGIGLGVKPVKPIRDEQMLENEDEIVVPTPMLGKGRFISGSYSYTGPDNVLVTVTYKANDSNVPKEEASDDQSSAEDQEQDEENYQEAEEDEEDYSRSAVQDEVEQQDDSADVIADESAEDSVVPTPPSLPAELARAFDFHKRKQQREEEKTQQKPYKNKKPIKGLHGLNKKKGSQSAEGHHQQGNAGNRRPAYGEHHQTGSTGHRQPVYGGHHQQAGHHQQTNDGNFGMKINPSQDHQGGYNYVPPVINQGYSYAKHN